MPAPGLATISTLQVISLGKDQVRPIHVVVHALNQGRGFRLWVAAHIWILTKATAKKNSNLSKAGQVSKN